MEKIKPKFQFKFQFQAAGRDETQFPVGSIVDETGEDLFPNRSFRDAVFISPNQNWALLFEYTTGFALVLNLNTKESYPVGFFEEIKSFWVGPQTLKWTHSGINDIRESAMFGASFVRFSVGCEHEAGGQWKHPIHFVTSSEFPKFANENKELLDSGKNRKIWYAGDFESLEVGFHMIQSHQQWNYFSEQADGKVVIVPRGKVETFVCNLSDLEKFYKS